MRSIVMLTAFLLLPSGVAFADGPAPNGVRVTTVGQSEGSLQLRGGNGRYQRVCSLPCDMVLPAGAELRLEGPGVRASAPFKLADARSVMLQVDPARTSTFVMGTIIAGIGAALMLAGPFAFVLLSASGVGTERVDFTPFGYVALVGAAHLGVGIPTLVGAYQSQVQQLPRAARVGEENPHGVLLGPWVAPQSWTLPFASGSF